MKEYELRGPYAAIYALKPAYEDLKDGGPGWYKLKWRPLWGKTFQFYFWKFDYGKSRLRVVDYGAHNGWHRSYECKKLELGMFGHTIGFWFAWNFIVHKDGPGDMGFKKPLVID